MLFIAFKFTYLQMFFRLVGVPFGFAIVPGKKCGIWLLADPFKTKVWDPLLVGKIRMLVGLFSTRCN
jgi:hypothetical protein